MMDLTALKEVVDTIAQMVETADELSTALQEWLRDTPEQSEEYEKIVDLQVRLNAALGLQIYPSS